MAERGLDGVPVDDAAERAEVSPRNPCPSERSHPAAARPTNAPVFVLVLAVPALLVVLLGYSLGYGVWSGLVGDAGAEPAGWVTGAVLLVVTVRVALVLWRRRRR